MARIFEHLNQINGNFHMHLQNICNKQTKYLFRNGLKMLKIEIAQKIKK